jgi:hypothetical protein
MTQWDALDECKITAHLYSALISNFCLNIWRLVRFYTYN